MWELLAIKFQINFLGGAVDETIDSYYVYGVSVTMHGVKTSIIIELHGLADSQ